MNTLKKAFKLSKEGKYKELIDLVDNLKVDFDVINPQLYLLKALSIQLCNEDIKYSLDDVEELLKKIIDIDNKNIEGLIELGYFYLNVKSDSTNAEKYFEMVRILSEKYLDEIEDVKMEFTTNELYHSLHILNSVEDNGMFRITDKDTAVLSIEEDQNVRLDGVSKQAETIDKLEYSYS